MVLLDSNVLQLFDSLLSLRFTKLTSISHVKQNELSQDPAVKRVYFHFKEVTLTDR